MPLSFAEREQLLLYVDMFAGLRKRDIRSLVKACEERRYPPGQALCEQGEKGIALFVIAEGDVQVQGQLPDGSRVGIAQLGPGSVVGEMAILDGAERTATVVALTQVDALVLTAWDFMAVLRKRPEVALDILPVIVRRFRHTAAELRQLTQQTAGPAAAPARADGDEVIPLTKRDRR